MKKKRVKIVTVDWDVSDDTCYTDKQIARRKMQLEKSGRLPRKVRVPLEVIQRSDETFERYAGIATSDTVCDWLSDKYGYCVNNCGWRQ